MSALQPQFIFSSEDPGKSTDRLTDKTYGEDDQGAFFDDYDECYSNRDSYSSKPTQKRRNRFSCLVLSFVGLLVIVVTVAIAALFAISSITNENSSLEIEQKAAERIKVVSGKQERPRNMARHRKQQHTQATADYIWGSTQQKGRVQVTAQASQGWRQAPSLDYGVLDDSGAAYAIYDDTYNVTGWDQLWITALPNTAPVDAMFAAGYLEGALTAQNIWYMYRTNRDDWWGHGNKVPDDLMDYIDENLQWMEYNIEEAKKESNSANLTTEQKNFWWAAELFLEQFHGLVAGYNDHCLSGTNLTVTEMAFLMADGDCEELGQKFGSGLNEQPIFRTRCTGVVKLAKDLSDLFFGHATWDNYSYMLRILKVYNLTLACSPGQRPETNQCTPFTHTEAVSSSPGLLVSMDDFIITSEGVVAMDTSHALYVKQLFEEMVPYSALTWMRILVAGMLANGTEPWARYFSMYNSGTYNNQWSVIDLKKFTPGSPLAPQGFMVVEQMPGLIEYQDMTAHLNEYSYWGSYNIPYFEDIYNNAGWAAMRVENGDEYSYWDNSRGKLLARLNTEVDSVERMKWLLRHNEWQTEPESLGNSSFAMAARYDLKTINATMTGAIDAKVSSVQMAWNSKDRTTGQSHPLSFVAVCGPTNQEQPDFVWRKGDPLFNVTHMGQPEHFNFTWVDFDSNWR